MTLVDKHDDRLPIARDLGIQEVPLQPDFQSDRARGRRTWPLGFEASGKATGLKTALEVAANEARVLVGDYGSVAVPMAATTVMRKGAATHRM